MSIADLVVRLRLEAEQLKSGLQGVQQNIRNWSNDIKDVGAGMTKWITAPIVGLAGGLIKTGVEFKAFKQEAQAAFSVLLGSKDLADQFMDDVLQFARTTPFAFPDLLDGTRKMVAFGMEADTSLVVIDAIANAVAAMGGGAVEIDQLSDVFAKITSNGRLTMSEINRLGDQGINALKILANQYGVTVEEMSKMVSAGAVDGETAIQFLVDGIMNGTEGVAGSTVAMAGSLEKIKGTWKGTMDSLKGAWRNAADAIISDELFAKIGDSVWKLIDIINKLPELVGPLVANITDVLMGLVDGISNMVDWFFNLDPATQQMIVQFIALLVAAGPLLMIIGQVGLGVAALISVFGFLLSPVGLIIAGIVALVAIFVYLWNTNETLRNGLIAIWEGIKGAALAIWGALQAFWEEHGEAIKAMFQAAWDLVSTYLSIIWGVISAVAMAVFGALQAFWDNWGSTIVAVFSAAWDQVRNIFTTVVAIITNMFKLFTSLLKGDWEGAWEAIKAIGQAAWTFLKNSVENLKNALSAIWNGIKTNAIQIWENIKSAVVAKANELRASVVSTVQSAVDFIKGLPSQALNWGKDIINGLIQGIRDMAGKAIEAITGVVNGIINAAKNLLKSDSPSKLFHQIGSDIGLGLSQGMEAAKDMVAGASISMTGASATGVAPMDAGGSRSSGTVNFDLNGLFAGAHITIGSERDAKSMAREIFRLADARARSEGVMI